MICFISLVILRLIQLEMNNKFSVKRIVEALSSISVIRTIKGIYSVSRPENDVTDAFENISEFDFNFENIKAEKLQQKVKMYTQPF